MTPIAWKMPLLMKSDPLRDPRFSASTRAPCVMTVINMTSMLINAIVDAFANCTYGQLETDHGGCSQLRTMAHTFAISRYKERGNEMPRMKMTMTKRRSENSQSTGVSERCGKIAVKTCGMLSPTITQNATIPPNALWRPISAYLHAQQVELGAHKINCAS